MTHRRKLAAIAAVLASLMIAALAQHADARFRDRRQSRRVTTRPVAQSRTVRQRRPLATWRIGLRPDDQSAAEAKAETMQNANITGHPGHPIGDFEGTGKSTVSRLPATCTPPPGMTLTADATSCGPNGCFRVRAWRRTQ